MLEKLAENIVSSREELNKSVYMTNREVYTPKSLAVELGKNVVPLSHRRVADNYFIIKKVFKFQACLSRISNVEKSLLNNEDLKTLENTTVKEMYEEIKLLQQWATNGSIEQRKLADEIFAIRVKELKFIEASCYATVSNELNTGYKTLESYLKVISKFQPYQYFK